MVGNPATAKTPAATLQMANCEPTEISISAVRTISVMPTATISTGTLASSKSRRLAKVKKSGAATARTAADGEDGRGDGNFALAITQHCAPVCPSASSEQILLRGVFARDDACDFAAAHDRDAVAHAENLGQLRRDHDDGEAALGEIDDELVDFGFRADVDALGGLVEDENFGLRGEPAGQRDLLLIAAGERAGFGVNGGRLHLQLFDVARWPGRSRRRHRSGRCGRCRAGWRG